jgi:hypothetical protein
MKTSNQTFQTIAYALALLFCLAFVAPVAAQSPDNQAPGFLKTLVGWIVQITTSVLNLIVQHFDAVYNFTVKYVWPFLKQIITAIWNAFYPKQGAY